MSLTSDKKIVCDGCGKLDTSNTPYLRVGWTYEPIAVSKEHPLGSHRTHYCPDCSVKRTGPRILSANPDSHGGRP